MTDETRSPTTPEPPTRIPARSSRRPPSSVDSRPPSSADTHPRRPEHRGEELDPERGPGLGCFWFQVIVLAFFIALIPIGLNFNWPFELLAILLFVVLGLLLLTGQTVIFLLRLVAADRRAQGRRRPLARPTKTVGELEAAHREAHAAGGARQARADVPVPADVPAAADEPAAADVPLDIGAPASRAMIRDEGVLGTPAAGDLGLEPGGESDAGDVSGAPARTTEGDAAAPGGAAGAAEGLPAARMHESPPDGRRRGRPLAAGAEVSAADVPAAEAAEVPAAGLLADAAPADVPAAAAAAPADVPAAAAAPADDAGPADGTAATDESGPGEPPEEPDPGVRQ